MTTNKSIDWNEDKLLKKLIDYLKKKHYAEKNIRLGYTLKEGEFVFRADAVILDNSNQPIILVELKTKVDSAKTIEHFKSILSGSKCSNHQNVFKQFG